VERAMLEKILTVRKKRLLSEIPVSLITDRTPFSDSLAGDTQFLDTVAACLDGGIRMVQLNESRQTSDRKFLALAKQLRALTAEKEALLIVHQRADIAKAVDADGLHLGPKHLDVTSARKILGHESLIGFSVHSTQEAQLVSEEEVDYFSAGPFFPSEYGPVHVPRSLSLIDWMNSHVQVPWFAAGGISQETLSMLPGIQRVMVSRALMRSRDPRKATQTLLAAINPTERVPAHS
jgi:thiamine-phosphate pyrophosphorylase